MPRCLRSLLSTLLLVGALLSPVAHAETDPPSSMETSLLRFMNKYYAITLAASVTERDAAAMRKAFPDLIVYQTTVSVAGTRLHFLRLGFFATRADAEAVLPRARSWYPEAWVVQASPLEQVSALGVDLETLAAKQPAQPEPPPAPKPSGLFALHLDVAEKPQFTPPVLPPSLQVYRPYVLRITGAQGVEYHLNIGVFESRDAAERARTQLLARYPQAAVREVTPGEKAQVAALPAPAGRAAAAKPPAPAGADDAAQKAKVLLDRAQDQIIAHQYDAALKTLTQILVLPKNIYTADAVEYTGVAHDRAGNIQQAIVHYQVYLRVYPDGPGAYRVKQRLLALQSAPPAPPAAPPKPATAVAGLYEPHVVGTLSQFYNHGASHSTVNVPSAGEQPLLAETQQSSIATNLSLTASYPTERYDNRFVLRELYTYYHTPDQPVSTLPVYDSTSYLSSAYYETKDKQLNTAARLGRLMGTNWGIFGRYDGGQFLYNFTPGWRVALSAGTPKEYDVDAQRSFYGASLDFGPVASHWFGNLYYLRQDVNGYVDREAVGTELRYSDTLHSVYTLFDYDTSYEVLNVGVFQLNWRTAGTMTYNLLVDHRLLPTMQTTNAVFGNADPSINQSFSQAEQVLSIDEIRQLARDRTVTSNNYSAGLYWQATPKWQLGGDVRLYNIGVVPPTETNPVQTLPSGDIYVYTVQSRGVGLFSPKDVAQISLSHKTGDSAEGNTLSLTNTSVIGGSWTLDARLRLTKERTKTASIYNDTTTIHNIETHVRSVIVSPSLHLSYRIRNSLSLEAEAGYEHSIQDTDTYDTVGGTTTHTFMPTDLTLRYFNLGYRWNF
jgi:tetratricopeptide (TPR) repeat protein